MSMFRTTKVEDVPVRLSSPATHDPLPVRHEPAPPVPPPAAAPAALSVVRPQAPVAATQPAKSIVAPAPVRLPVSASSITRAPSPPSAAPAQKLPSQPSNNTAPSGAVLAVGAGVSLKGSMQCDVLKVEGNVEGDVKAHKLVVATGGTLVGTVEIDDVEVEGHFEGVMTVSGVLVVRSTGRLSGKFHYGSIEIERGGAISGEIHAHSGFGHAAAAAPQPATAHPATAANARR